MIEDNPYESTVIEADLCPHVWMDEMTEQEKEKRKMHPMTAQVLCFTGWLVIGLFLWVMASIGTALSVKQLLWKYTSVSSHGVGTIAGMVFLIPCVCGKMLSWTDDAFN